MANEEFSGIFSEPFEMHGPQTSNTLSKLEAMTLPGEPEAHLQPVGAGHLPAFIKFVQRERDHLAPNLEWTDYADKRMASYLSDEANGQRLSFLYSKVPLTAAVL